MKHLKGLLADILFMVGTKFVVWSAKLCGYDETAKSISKHRVDAWRNRIK